MLADIAQAAIWATETLAADMPVGVAVVTMVFASFPLESVAIAGRARAAAVQPVAVGIQTVFYVILVDNYLKLGGQLLGLLPGGNF